MIGNPDDELVYLDLGGESGETLYFMTSSIASVEVKPMDGAREH